MGDAYVKDILANSVDSHQTSPGYVLTIVRWSNRDTLNYNSPLSPSTFDTRRPLTVINDAITVTVSNTKAGLSPTMTAILKGGDLNYKTAVHAGDYIFVNMLNWEKDVATGTFYLCSSYKLIDKIDIEDIVGSSGGKTAYNLAAAIEKGTKIRFPTKFTGSRRRNSKGNRAGFCQRIGILDPDDIEILSEK